MARTVSQSPQEWGEENEEKGKFVAETKQVTKTRECHEIATKQGEMMAMQRDNIALAVHVAELEQKLLLSKNEQRMTAESEEKLLKENQRLTQQVNAMKEQSSKAAVIQRQKYEQVETNPQELLHVATDSGLTPSANTRSAHRLQGNSPPKEQISEHHPEEF